MIIGAVHSHDCLIEIGPCLAKRGSNEEGQEIVLENGIGRTSGKLHSSYLPVSKALLRSLAGWLLGGLG